MTIFDAFHTYSNILIILNSIDRYRSTDRLAVTADRTAGNIVEQSVPFIAGLWLCAVFHSAEYATWVGWLWIASRSIYPFAFYYGLPYLLFSTVPGYLFIGMLFYPVAIKSLGM